MIWTRRSFITFATTLLITTSSFGSVVAGTPEASPAASPVATNDCSRLPGYFAAIAALVDGNDGLAIMASVGHDVLSLDDAEAATVVAEIDTLIAAIDEIDVPGPALGWQVAYLDLLRWYRDMAASRDPIALQGIINNDRRLFVNLGIAQLQGQQACPGMWDPAWTAAFGT